MKKLVFILLALLLGTLMVSTAGAQSVTSYVPIGGEWSYDTATGVLSGGSNARGEYNASSDLMIKPGEHCIVTVDMRIDAFGDECGAGLFFDSASPADSFGIGEGMGVMTWTSTSYLQFKTWSWDLPTVSTTNPGIGDYWDGVNNVVYGDTQTVYTITAEFDDDTITCSIRNKSTGAEHVLQGGALELVNNSDGLYVGVIALNCAASFSNLQCSGDGFAATEAPAVSLENALPAQTVQTVAPAVEIPNGVWLNDSVKAITGTWSVDASGAIKAEGDRSDSHATTTTYIAPGETATVSVDMKFDSTTAEYGAGLFFDSAAPDDSLGLGAGMGVMTWTSTDFQQFKTRSWNLPILSTTNPGFGDWWDSVDNVAYGDTNTVYTITATIGPDSIICSIRNNSTEAEHVLQDGALELINNANGLYVGAVTLNCGATFSNLIVTKGGAPAQSADLSAPVEIEAPAEAEAPEETESSAENEAPMKTETPVETEAAEETAAPAETRAVEEITSSGETSPRTSDYTILMAGAVAIASLAGFAVSKKRR